MPVLALFTICVPGCTTSTVAVAVLFTGSMPGRGLPWSSVGWPVAVMVLVVSPVTVVVQV